MNKDEFLLKADDLDWSLKNPCNDCPFIKTSPYHNGVAKSIPDIMTSIGNCEFVHTCHKTDNRPTVDGPRTFQGKTHACAGSIMMLLRTGKGMDLQLPLLQAAEQGKIDLADMTKRARASRIVFSVFGLLSFYAEETGRRCLRGRKKKKGPS